MNEEQGLSGACGNSETAEAERQATSAGNGSGSNGRAGRASSRTRLDGGHDGPPSPKGPFGRLLAEIEAGTEPAAGASWPRPWGERPLVDATACGTDAVRQAIAALGEDPEAYTRAGLIVRVSRDGGGEGRSIHADPSPRIEPVPLSILGCRLADAARYLAPGPRGGEPREGPPPEWLPKAVRDAGDYAGVRRLAGITEAPTLRPDGSVLQSPGWDGATALLYEPSDEFRGAFRPVPDRPSADDVRAAAGLLTGLVGDFQFASESDRSAWIALLATLIARPGIDGPVPLALIDANLPGSGKTLLADVACKIASGRPTRVTPTSGDAEELRKLATTVAIEGRQYVLLDNQTNGGKVGGRTLDMIVTARTWNDRLLGSNVSREIPINACWIMTGNNMVARGDLARRVVRCRLEADVERPERRTGFRIGDLGGHVLRERAAYVGAILAILRAHAAAGRPRMPGIEPMGGFEAWDAVVRGALIAAGLADPLGSAESMRAEDPGEAGERARLISSWAQLPDARGRGVTSNRAIQLLRDYPDRFEALREVACGLTDKGDLPTPAKLGYALRKVKGAVAAGLKLVSAPDRDGVTWWRVVDVSAPEGGPGAPQGDGGRRDDQSPGPAPEGPQGPAGAVPDAKEGVPAGWAFPAAPG